MLYVYRMERDVDCVESHKSRGLRYIYICASRPILLLRPCDSHISHYQNPTVPSFVQAVGNVIPCAMDLGRTPLYGWSHVCPTGAQRGAYIALVHFPTNETWKSGFLRYPFLLRYLYHLFFSLCFDIVNLLVPSRRPVEEDA